MLCFAFWIFKVTIFLNPGNFIKENIFSSGEVKKFDFENYKIYLDIFFLFPCISFWSYLELPMHLWMFYLKITFSDKSILTKTDSGRRGRSSKRFLFHILWATYQNNIIFWVKCKSTKLGCGSKGDASDYNFDITIDFCLQCLNSSALMRPSTLHSSWNVMLCWSKFMLRQLISSWAL